MMSSLLRLPDRASGPAEGKIQQTVDGSRNRLSPSLLNEAEAADFLHCSVALLRKQRLMKSGPSYINIGRLVRYELHDLAAFVDANKHIPLRPAA